MKQLLTTLTLVLIVILVNGQKKGDIQRSIKSQAPSSKSLRFAWTMGARYDEANQYYSRETHTYNKRLLSEEDGWIVKLDASENIPPYPNPSYTWQIEGLGTLANYNKTYTSNFPVLLADKILNVNATKNKISPPSKFQKPNNILVLKRRQGPVTDPEIHPVHPNPSTTLEVDRLPKIGSYKITLTIADQAHSRINAVTYSETITLKNIIIACLGDSYNAGEGNPDIYDDYSIPCQSDVGNAVITLFSKGLDAYIGSQVPFYTSVKSYLDNRKNEYDDDVNDPDIWYEPKAHRSLLSGPAIAARMIEDYDPHSAVTFIDLASTGATIERGLQRPQRQWQKEGQITELKNILQNNTVDFLTVSIGINDVAMTQILAQSIPLDFDKSKENDLKRIIDDVKYEYDKLSSILDDKIKPKKIILATYFDPLFSVTGSTGVSTIARPDHFPFYFQPVGEITLPEAQNLTEVAGYLNGNIREACRKHGWIVADAASDFNGHGYFSDYDNDDGIPIRHVPSFYRSLGESCNSQGDYMGMVHPNELGHAAYADKLLTIMKNIIIPPPPTIAPRPKTVRITFTSVKRLHPNSFRFHDNRFNVDVNYPAPLPRGYNQSAVTFKFRINNQEKEVPISVVGNQDYTLSNAFFEFNISPTSSAANMIVEAKDVEARPNYLGAYERFLYLWGITNGQTGQDKGTTKLKYPVYPDGGEDDVELFEISYKIELIKDYNPVIR